MAREAREVLRKETKRQKDEKTRKIRFSAARQQRNDNGSDNDKDNKRKMKYRECFLRATGTKEARKKKKDEEEEEARKKKKGACSLPPRTRCPPPLPCARAWGLWWCGCG